MISGLRIPGTGDSLSASRFGAFKYFTVDSNILMGIVAGYLAFRWKKVLDGKTESIDGKTKSLDGKTESLDKTDYILGLVGTTGVTLTMLVSFFYLAPTMQNGWQRCFSNSNIFLHAINPMLSICALVIYEKTDRLKLKDSLWAMIPMLIYATIYAVIAIAHAENDSVPAKYDIYSFFGFGLKSVFIVLPIIALITFGIGAGLYKLSHLKGERNERVNQD